MLLKYIINILLNIIQNCFKTTLLVEFSNILFVNFTEVHCRIEMLEETIFNYFDICQKCIQ